MALSLNDRVQETCSAPGTGAVTLLGAVTGFQTFSSGVGNGNTCYYCIADQGGANWEVGLGTYTSSGNTLTRTTPYSGSAATPVNFSSGVQTVFVTYPAEKKIIQDASGNVTALGTVSSGTWQGTTVAVSHGGTGVTTSTGSGSVVLSNSPALVTPNLDTPSAINLTNGTSLPLTTGVSGTLPTANGGTNLSSFTADGAVYATSTSVLTTGTLPLASGGTASTTAQGAMNTLAGATTSGYFLRGNGTNVVMAAIGASDLPSVITSTIQYGTLSYTPSAALGWFQTSTDGYNQLVLQNTSSGTSASNDLIVSNDVATDSTNYGDFGINSSNFSGSGAFSDQSGVYAYAQTGTMAVGTVGAQSLKLATNNTVRVTVNSSGAVGIGSSPAYGNSGDVLTSAGSGAAPTWTAPAGVSQAKATGINFIFSI